MTLFIIQIYKQLVVEEYVSMRTEQDDKGFSTVTVLSINDSKLVTSTKQVMRADRQ